MVQEGYPAPPVCVAARGGNPGLGHSGISGPCRIGARGDPVRGSDIASRGVYNTPAARRGYQIGLYLWVAQMNWFLAIPAPPYPSSDSTVRSVVSGRNSVSQSCANKKAVPCQHSWKEKEREHSVLL